MFKIAQTLTRGRIAYHVWGLTQERVYKTAVRDTADFKRRLIET